ncbi:hypothetical protein TNCV_3733891 [Trichonephila clavipes]|nr:hypothetical protein TNCV_3733891 [Trichonephila clavipes]
MLDDNIMASYEDHGENEMGVKRETSKENLTKGLSIEGSRVPDNVHPRPLIENNNNYYTNNNALKQDEVADKLEFGLAIHQNDHQARRRFVEWAQNEIAVVPDFQKRILFSDEEHFWLNGYVNKQNCRIWSEANPQVYVETPLHPEKLTVWCALWAGGILLQKR